MPSPELLSPRRRLALVLAGLLPLYVAGIGWGLPATDGWDDDGVAPRDFLYGLYDTFAPGSYYAYPPAHLALLAAVTSPIWAPELARAPSTEPRDLVRTFVTVRTMTALALAARLTQAALALGLVLVLGRIVADLAGGTAAVLAAAVCGLDGVLTYYAHTSNLDVPALFWSALGLSVLVRAMIRDEPRGLTSVGLLAALATASKDQAAALFVLTLPLALAGWLFAGTRSRRRLAVEALVGLGLGAVVLLALDGALTNPSGFARRLHFLFGPASADYAEVPPGPSHWPALVGGIAGRLGDFAPWPVLALGVAGLVLVVARPAPARQRLAALVPAVAALSFTLTFTLAARRAEHRFVLPQVLLLSTYAGIALERLWRAAPGRLRLAGRAAVVVALALAAVPAVAVDRALLDDPRLAVEALLGARVRPGERIETYGSNVYQPRFPARARVARVDDRRPLESRNPLPGVEEVLARYEAVAGRAPDWVVAPRAWTERWLAQPGGLASPLERELGADVAARRYFEALERGTLAGYERVLTAACPATGWPPPPRIHHSTCEEVDVLRRVGADEARPGPTAGAEVPP